MINTIQDYAAKVSRSATKILTEDVSDDFVYHNITYIHRMINGLNDIIEAEDLSDYQSEVVRIAAWLNFTGLKDIKHVDIDSPKALFQQCNKCSAMISRQILSGIDYPPEKTEHVLKIMFEAVGGDHDREYLAQILSDAITIDWGRPKGMKHVKSLYDEFLLTGALSVGKKGWYDGVLSYLTNHIYYSNYGKQVLEPGKQKLISKINKEKKELEKYNDGLIQRELDLNAADYKKMKKSLNAVKGRDDRAIQTMFRTTSRNHYTLNQMNDRKANIMISINAILLSLIVGRVIGQQIDTFCIHNSPVLIVLISSAASIVLAILAITPATTQGRFTAADVRQRKGNLLYFGNFHGMKFNDYEWGMQEMLNDGNYLYSVMIQDLYFLGKTLHKKSSLIRSSLTVFMIGFALSVIVFLFVSTMADFHVGNGQQH